MRAVAVHLDALDLFCINVAGDVVPSVQHQNLLAAADRLMGEDCAVQACADDQIIICHVCLLQKNVFPQSAPGYTLRLSIPYSLQKEKAIHDEK